MINKLMVGSLTVALLFGGAFQTTADASASENNTQNQSYQHKVYYSVNGGDWTEGSNEKFSNYLNKHFPQVNWNKQQENNSKQPKQDQSEKNGNAEQAKSKQETNKKQEEQTEQDKSEQDTNNQQEQETEQPEAQAPQQPAEQQNQQTQQNKQNQTQDSQQLSEFEQQVVELTNQEREAQGLEPLKIDTELSKVAREKSRDMAANNYFSHNSPNYGSPFDMMKEYGISYQTAGENIARGQTSPEQVVNGWMNSEGHRENILNENFTHIGVGYVEQGNHWTQQFIGK